ncbi:MAG: conserved membrane protein of unknown function [Promethearchaeota archaeon]|nr:MAG: conserved membrane protein of unknown function [Candidatus Lokiarchaeota archaeon]
MLNFIICGIIAIWILYKRVIKKDVVKEYPLGLPRGTVRALTTLLIVTFPFSYLLFDQTIPGFIINAIFILVAFYFAARKTIKWRIETIIKEMKPDFDLTQEEKKEKYPLYLPQYSVRISLILIIVLILTLNALGPNVAFEYTNTLLDLLLIIVVYVIGSVIRAYKNKKEKERIKDQIRNLKNYEALTDVEIIEQVVDEKPKKWQLRGKGILSILMSIAITIALIFYTVNFDIEFSIFSLREILLLTINLYYGFRD